MEELTKRIECLQDPVGLAETLLREATVSETIHRKAYGTARRDLERTTKEKSIA